MEKAKQKEKRVKKGAKGVRLTQEALAALALALSTATLFDDAFMRLVFKLWPILVQEIIRRVIGRMDLVVKKVTVQDDNRQLLARSAVFDVLAVDSEGKYYDIEIQKDDEGASPERARFHSAVMDAQLLKKGAKHKEMPESFVIFLTENDVMGDGCPIYWFDRIDVKTGKPLGDGSHIIYVNGAWDGDDLIGELMHDMKCMLAEEMRIALFAETIGEVKNSENTQNGKVGEAMCNFTQTILNCGIEQGRAEGEKRGLAKGEKRGLAKGLAKLRESAKRMLALGKLTLEEIADVTGLALKEVQALAAANGGRKVAAL